MSKWLEHVEAMFTVLPISSRACARILELPADYPRDPADRIIAATALVDGMTLVTADRNILGPQAVRTLW